MSVRARLFLLSSALIVASFVAARWLSGSPARDAAVLVVAALVVATVTSLLGARWLSWDVAALTIAARRMTVGDLDVRTHVRGADEVGELGSALDQLAGNLSVTLRELRAERDLQTNILDGMEEGVLVLDSDGHVVLMNRALREMLFVGSTALGRPLIEVVRNASLIDLVGKAILHAERTTRGEIELPGVKPRRLLSHVSALSGPDKRVVAVFVDVTDLRRLESMRRDFVANVSHELRTPVTAVRSASETLLAGALGDPTAAVRFVEIIARHAERLQSLIDDLLDLSRFESNQFRLRSDPVDLRVLANAVIALFREKADRKRVTLTSRLGHDLPVMMGDPRALEQVLSNLVDNAIKYCPAGSTISLSATAEEGTLALAVSDNGPGIEQGHIPRLFERFYRIDAGRSRDVGGTGLGLSIVKHLVEAMGGEIAVESALGVGSTFSVRVPRS